MNLTIRSKTEAGAVVLEKLTKKKNKGVKIGGGYTVDGSYKAVFKFNKFLSKISQGFEKYLLPQHKKFIDDYLLGEGLTKTDYEVLIN